MGEELDIVVTGIDVGAHDAARKLAQAFDLSAAEAEQFVRELPRVAKRRASRDEAERYLDALRSIGARVEAVPSGLQPATVRARLPATSDQPLQIEQPAAPAIRLRASGDLQMVSMPPNDVLYPSIPKAPIVPRDLNRMPNGVMQMPSLRPFAEDDGGFPDEDEPRRHTDAQLPPPLIAAVRATPRKGQEQAELPARLDAAAPVSAPVPAAAAAPAPASPAAPATGSEEEVSSPHAAAAAPTSAPNALARIWVIAFLVCAALGFLLARCLAT